MFKTSTAFVNAHAIDDLIQRAFSPETSPLHIETVDEGVFLHIDVPGFDKKQLSVTVENDILHIDGVSSFGGKERVVNIHRKINNSKFEIDDIESSMELGILSVFIPFKTTEKDKQIDIKIK